MPHSAARGGGDQLGWLACGRKGLGCSGPNSESLFRGWLQNHEVDRLGWNVPRLVDMGGMGPPASQARATPNHTDLDKEAACNMSSSIRALSAHVEAKVRTFLAGISPANTPDRPAIAFATELTPDRPQCPCHRGLSHHGLRCARGCRFGHPSCGDRRISVGDGARETQAVQATLLPNGLSNASAEVAGRRARHVCPTSLNHWGGETDAPFTCFEIGAARGVEFGPAGACVVQNPRKETPCGNNLGPECLASGGVPEGQEILSPRHACSGVIGVPDAMMSVRYRKSVTCLAPEYPTHAGLRN